MAQKWTDVSGAGSTSRLLLVQKAAIHLSDGTLVFLEYDNSLNILLKYSSDHVTVNTIATVTGFNTTQYSATLSQNIILCRDASDNIFVVGTNGTQPRAQAFTKGAGYTWTAQTALVATGAFVTTMACGGAVWCNTGGGTGGHGHIMAIFGCASVSRSDAGYVILDAGILLAGAGTVQTSFSSSIAWIPGSFGSGNAIDLSNDGFGATSGLAISISSSGNVVGTWSVNSSGALASSGTVTPGFTSVNNGKCRLLRYAANAWAIVNQSSTGAGRYAVARYSSTAQLTASADSGTPANLPLNSAGPGWDAFVDPVTPNKIWIIADAAVSGGNQNVYRIGVSVGSGVVFDAAVTLDDTLTGTSATQSDVRAVKEPVAAKPVDWQAFVQTAATPTYALYGDYAQFASAPSAPTLSSPANAASIDVAAGLTVQAIYNSTDASNQNAYALRIKTSGAGSYSYWNAGTNALQSTIVWNPIATTPGSTFSVTLPNTVVADGNVYNWSLASQEASASLQGSFAADFTFTAQAAPVVSGVSPSGTITASQIVVSWTTSPGAGAVQTTYRVVVESGAYGTTPGSGTVAWDSGTIAGTNQSLQIGVGLANSTSYRIFVQVAETGGELSAWSYSTVTTLFDAPAPPVVTPVWDAANARVVLTLWGQDNLLSSDNSTFETTVGSWVAGTSTTVARTTAQARDGVASMSLTATAAANISAHTPTGVAGIPVLPNVSYAVMASFRAAVTVRATLVTVSWYTGAGALINSVSSATVNDASGAWVQASVVAVAPANAAFASITVQVNGAANTEVHYVDQVGLYSRTTVVPVWSIGGFSSGGAYTVEASEDGGTTWKAVRGGPFSVDATQQAVINDYERTPLATVTYRARVSDNAGAGTLVSVNGPTASIVASGVTSWWVKDVRAPANNLPLCDAQENVRTRAGDATAVYPAGRVNPLVLKGPVHGAASKLRTVVQSEAARLAALTLFTTSDDLLIQDPRGRQWYAEWVGDLTDTQLRTDQAHYALERSWVEVDVPS